MAVKSSKKSDKRKRTNSESKNKKNAAKKSNAQKSKPNKSLPMNEKIEKIVPVPKSSKKKSATIFDKALTKIQKLFSLKLAYDLMFSPRYFYVAASLFLLIEAFINVFIIENIKYTEIDWIAYMQEVEGFLNGTTDYTKLKGDTGPLVYPAGFVYIFSALYYVTNRGTNIYLAQYIFAGFYLLTLAFVFRLYCKSKKLPPYVLLFICGVSYRVHSIYVLRLFNDPIAMLLLYAALNAFVSGKWTLGSFLFSLAVSVKMNILLFAPALLATYLYSLGLMKTILQLIICLGVQVVLALPFLATNPLGYIRQAFNLGRIFLFEWTVNWRFLPEPIFVNPWFHMGLLAAHVLFLVVFFFTHWKKLLIHFESLRKSGVDVSSQLFLLPMFICNFVGMVFSRSLHYQFYIWYYHSIPYLLWSTRLGISFKLSAMGFLELCWNTFPSTWWSSGLLHACHILILFALLDARPKADKIEATRKKLAKKD